MRIRFTADAHAHAPFGGAAHKLVCKRGCDMGSNENWFLFLLIVMLAFASDGTVSSTETAVMLAILFALTVAGPTLTSSDDTSSNPDTTADTSCFCNR